MPLLDFVWACFRRAKVRSRVFKARPHAPLDSFPQGWGHTVLGVCCGGRRARACGEGAELMGAVCECMSVCMSACICVLLGLGWLPPVTALLRAGRGSRGPGRGAAFPSCPLQITGSNKWCLCCPGQASPCLWKAAASRLFLITAQISPFSLPEHPQPDAFPCCEWPCCSNDTWSPQPN